MSKRRINEINTGVFSTIDSPQMNKKIQTSNVAKSIQDTQNFQDDDKFNPNNTNLKQKSEEIIQILSQRYIPPKCQNCQNRKRDRVCVNKDCGLKDFLTLICSQCHNIIHEKSSTKSELILEECFEKLSYLIESQGQNRENNEKIQTDINKLKAAVSEVSFIREKLNGLRTQLQLLASNFLPIKESITQVEESTIKFLSSDKLENKNEQLDKIKQMIFFNNNEFHWKNVNYFHKTFNNNLKDVENNINELQKNTTNSFSRSNIIDLKQLVFLQSRNLTHETTPIDIEYKNTEIKLTNTVGKESQVYLNFLLIPTKKYKLRFRFESQIIQSHTILGIMPLSKVDVNWVFGVKDQYFCKRFYACYPPMECSRIIRGIELSTSFHYGTQIEIRIDFENNYIDFTDYPNHKSINANHTQYQFIDEPYVFAFSFHQFQQIVIEQIEEVFQIEEL